MEKIKVKNDYNLNIPRYIDHSTLEDLQNIEAHLCGSLQRLWTPWKNTGHCSCSERQAVFRAFRIVVDQSHPFLYRS